MSTRLYTGRMPDGTPVRVRVWGDTAELEFRDGDGARGRWGLPVDLTEEVVSKAAVVLDLEYPEGLLATLRDSLSHMLAGSPNHGRLTGLIAAIEAQTKPPKPPEPRGLGAVVEDAKGRRYVRATVDGSETWLLNDAPEATDPRYGYDHTGAVRVLSEGVQP